jgi:hypothetical protein
LERADFGGIISLNTNPAALDPSSRPLGLKKNLKQPLLESKEENSEEYCVEEHEEKKEDADSDDNISE